MSRRRQPYEPTPTTDFYRSMYGEQRQRDPADLTVIPEPSADDAWVDVLGDLVLAVLCGVFVVLAWVAGAWWLGITG